MTTTIETRNEHLQAENSKLTSKVSRLQGVVHGQALEIGQLISDVNLLRGRLKSSNVDINQLQERCSTCGVGNGE